MRAEPQVIRTKNFVTDAADFILGEAQQALGERNEFRIALSGGNTPRPGDGKFCPQVQPVAADIHTSTPQRRTPHIVPGRREEKSRADRARIARRLAVSRCPSQSFSRRSDVDDWRSLMRTVVVTGSAGLIGSETVKRFAGEGARVIGIDNDMREKFFGPEASTKKTRDDLIANVRGYEHHDLDIRDAAAMEELFKQHRGAIDAIVHTASQPSHDWAARDPQTDITVKANGTLNLLEAARKFSPEAPFIFTSTNKVYGDTPNRLPLRELAKRWEIEPGHEYEPGISETMSIDSSKHSLFGVSKAAADLLVQEYGRYFEMPTVVFRGGCLTGPGHAGTELQGFLSYLMICAVSGRP